MYDGQFTRFVPEFDDDAFYTLTDKIGGVLPPGWKAWHLEQSEIDNRGPRVLEIAKRPTSWVSAERVAEELLMDARIVSVKTRKEDAQ